MPLSNIFLAKYCDHSKELKHLINSEKAKGLASIVWNHSKGFTLYHDLEIYPLSENNDSVLKDPKEALNFILNRAQANFIYILEDFHHYIGNQATVHPDIGEIRSLIKEIANNSTKREEKIYVFVPSSYELPDELSSFFDQSWQKKKNSKSFLDKYGTLLTDEDYIRKLKPVIGVNVQIERVIQILSQMETNNPLLVGYPGVGKTAIVEGFARALFNGLVPPGLKGKMFYLISLNNLVAGTKYRGEFEQRLEGLIKDVCENKNSIMIFIDEIHTLLGVGSAEGTIGAGDALKPVLARGEFPCVGATTFDGAQILLKDHALSRRFKKVLVKESSPKETYVILRGIAGTLAKHHLLTIEDKALVAAVSLSKQHMTDEYFPGKAIALLDATAAYCSINSLTKVRGKDVAAEVERMQTL